MAGAGNYFSDDNPLAAHASYSIKEFLVAAGQQPVADARRIEAGFILPSHAKGLFSATLKIQLYLGSIVQIVANHRYFPDIFSFRCLAQASAELCLPWAEFSLWAE